ncbi:TPA: hypothetical protein ACH3X1_009171 [Trebouxia sp. C0004]
MPMAPRRLQQAQLHGHSAILADLRSQKPQRLPVFSAQVRALGALLRQLAFNRRLDRRYGSIIQGINYSNVERWTLPERLMSSTGSDTCVLEKDLILIPVHVSANGTGPPNHWIDGREPLNEIVMSNVLAWTQVEASNAKHANGNVMNRSENYSSHMLLVMAKKQDNILNELRKQSIWQEGQRWPRGPKESAELYPLVWSVMHVQPYPSTQTIKQQTLVYAECTSDSEFKGKFAPDLANRYFSDNLRGKAASAVHEMAMQVYDRMADDSRDRSTTLQSLTTDEKVTGHVRIEETSFSYNELAFVTLEVLKVLNDDVVKSRVHPNQIHSENKAICSSLSAEYDQNFGQTENEPKFRLATTVSQA